MRPTKESLQSSNSCSSRAKDNIHSFAPEITGRSKSYNSFARNSSVGGLLNLVKIHASIKSPQSIQGESGASDPHLNKFLAKLDFIDRVSRVQLQEMRLFAPWFMKLHRVSHFSNGDNLILDSLNDSDPSSNKDLTSGSDQIEFDNLNKLSQDIHLNPDKILKKKWHLLCELQETEFNFLTHLNNILRLFRDPLYSSPANDFVPHEALVGIFGNLERILALSNELNSDLKRLVGIEDEIETKCIGPTFLLLSSKFRCYLDYVKGYLEALDLVKKWENLSSHFKGVLTRGALENPARQTLKEMLILPIQRLARYSLLLRSLQKCTPDDHVDYNFLDMALNQMTGLAVEANEIQRIEEDALTTQAIFDSVHNCPTFLRGSKYKHAFVSEAQELKLRRRVCMFVYSDSIIFTVARKQWGLGSQNGNSTPSFNTAKWKFIQFLPLSRIELVEIMDRGKPAELCLLVIHPEPNSNSGKIQNEALIPSSPRYYLLRHLERRHYLEFIHLLKARLKKISIPTPSHHHHSLPPLPRPTTTFYSDPPSYDTLSPSPSSRKPLPHRPLPNLPTGGGHHCAELQNLNPSIATLYNLLEFYLSDGVEG